MNYFEYFLIQTLQFQQFQTMSSGRNFLPAHPKIVKRLNEKSQQSIKTSRSNNKSTEFDPQTVQYLIDSQKEQIKHLQEQLETITSKNNIMETSLSFYNNQDQKAKLNHQIQLAKAQQLEIKTKINNCQKVGESTTPEQYYLWQKKKKTNQFNKKLQAIVHQNQQERQHLRQLCGQYRDRIDEYKQEIQEILHEIQMVQNSFKTQDSVNNFEVIQPEKIIFVQQEYETLKSTISILRENNEILSSQLEDGIQSIELTLRKSFENSRSTLIRELQSIKKEIESSEPSTSQDKAKHTSPADAISEYVSRLNKIQQLLSKEEAEEASNIIKPFDWTSLKWEQYLDFSGEDENVNYSQKFQALSKEHQSYEKQMKALEKQIQEAINQSVKLTQQNMEIESASIKLAKILQLIKK